MKILVIGNGFDLEHGLPTKYKDFLHCVNLIKGLNAKNMYRESYEIALKNIDIRLRDYLESDEIFEKDKRSNSINELIELAEKNIWINYFNSSKFKENKDKGWIDFESEISNVIKSWDYIGKQTTKAKIENKEEIKYSPYHEKDGKYILKSIEHAIKFEKNIDVLENKDRISLIINEFNENQFKDQIIKRLNNHLNDLIRCLEIYLEDCVKKIDIEYLAPDLKGIKFDKVLSFNYTNTYERIYDFNNNDIEYHYIHGKADINRNTTENNMVLGIDEYLGKKSKNKELEFIAFKKYFQRIYKKTGNEYKKWTREIEKEYRDKFESEKKFREKLHEATISTEVDHFKKVINGLYDNKNEIYIFGHSLDITDKDIIKDLIECENTVTTIFYYNKEVYAQQIANLVKVIGQDELIKRVSGETPTIIFKQQQQRIKRN